jgi:hypothetical protein
VTGNWATYTYPSGTYGVGQTFQITLGGVTKNPAGFTILSECDVARSNGSIIYFDNWGTDVTYSYTFRPTDPEGTWTVYYCQLLADFDRNSGWPLKQDNTQHTFILDKTPPSITINAPRQNDVYARDFVVDATVTDSYSSIASVQYRWENASSTGTWASMALGGGRYTANFAIASVADGAYSVRVKATDSVGNSNEAVVANVLIDRQPPNITILAPSQGWRASNFETKVRVTDNQGISVVRYRLEGPANSSWYFMTKDASGDYTNTFVITSIVWGNYTLRVVANDTMGNVAEKTLDRLGIDYVPPVSRMISPVPGTFITNVVFNVSWSGSDSDSGINCHYVVYKYLDNAGRYSGEYNVSFPGGNCTSLTQFEFNPAQQLSFGNYNNFTFFFRSVALDNAGNLEAKAAWETNVTIYIPRLVTFTVTEKVTGEEIMNGGKVANNRTVVVNVKARDSVPGNLDIRVYYFSHGPGVIPPAELSNWSSYACTSARECNASISTESGEHEDIIELDYVVSANNAEFIPPYAPSSYFYYRVYLHPISNFLVDSIFRTTIGASEIIEIEVRNIQRKTGTNVGLKFDSGMARFLENGQRYIQIPLNPMEEKIIYARLVPPPPSQEGLPLIMTGNTSADPLLADEDTIAIIVGLPANFSEMGALAAIILIAMACVIFLKTVKPA